MIREQHEELAEKVKGLALQMAELLSEEERIPQVRIIREVFCCGLKEAFQLQETLARIRYYAECKIDEISPVQP
jgi:hypothetical protein